MSNKYFLLYVSCISILSFGVQAQVVQSTQTPQQHQGTAKFVPIPVPMIAINPYELQKYKELARSGTPNVNTQAQPSESKDGAQKKSEPAPSQFKDIEMDLSRNLTHDFKYSAIKLSEIIPNGAGSIVVLKPFETTEGNPKEIRKFMLNGVKKFKLSFEILIMGDWKNSKLTFLSNSKEFESILHNPQSFTSTKNCTLVRTNINIPMYTSDKSALYKCTFEGVNENKLTFNGKEVTSKTPNEFSFGYKTTSAIQEKQAGWALTKFKIETTEKKPITTASSNLQSSKKVMSGTNGSQGGINLTFVVPMGALPQALPPQQIPPQPNQSFGESSNTASKPVQQNIPTGPIVTDPRFLDTFRASQEDRNLIDTTAGFAKDGMVKNDAFCSKCLAENLPVKIRNECQEKCVSVTRKAGINAAKSSPKSSEESGSPSETDSTDSVTAQSESTSDNQPQPSPQA